MKHLIVLSGASCAGKSTIARSLAELMGGMVMRSRDAIRVYTGHNPTQAQLVERGNKLDAESPVWLAAYYAANERHAQVNIIDCVRRMSQLHSLYALASRGVLLRHFHIDCTNGERARRDSTRLNRERGLPEEHGDINLLRRAADYVLQSDALRPDDAAHIIKSLVLPQWSLAVDVIVGAQYGSEGKGHVIASTAHQYSALVRVGGPNAGHTVLDPVTRQPFAFKSIPSGALHSPGMVAIGPGATLLLPVLMKELHHVERLRHERMPGAGGIFIDPQAVIISDSDITDERGVVGSIGSTGQGVGAATARRILDRGKRPVMMAKDVSELASHIRPLPEVLQEASSSGPVMLEGTQGTGLSLYHGPYPHVTSRDTTASGTMAEAGIPPKAIRDVVMVTRSMPIRVQSPEGGTSGPMNNEITWEDVATDIGIDADVLRERERTTTTHRLRRVSRFDWPLFVSSSRLNRPTKLALTFADYIDPANREARSWDELSFKTRSFIHLMEQVSGAECSMVSVDFKHDSVVDTRWEVRK